MANPTIIPIQSYTVGATSVSSVTFSSILFGYTDLLVRVSARATNASTVCNIQWTFNGSTTGYSGLELYGSGSASGTGNGGSTTSYIQLGYATGNNATASTFGNTDVYIPNYSGQSNKSIQVDGTMETAATGSYVDMGAGLWSNTSAIYQITMTPTSGLWMPNSTFYLYGINRQ
jgi:hypothetical protein